MFIREKRLQKKPGILEFPAPDTVCLSTGRLTERMIYSREVGMLDDDDKQFVLMA